MMESANFVLEFGFYLLLGWLAMRMVATIANRHLERTVVKLDAEIIAIRKVYKRVKIEEHSGIFYVFDADTEEFLGQGSTAEEFADRLKNDLVLQPVQGDPDVIERFRKTIPQTDLA